MQDLYYKDYFSINTLSRFSVDPLLELNLNERIENILKPFNPVKNNDIEYLIGKVNAACLDNDLTTKKMSIKLELDDDLFEDKSPKSNDEIEKELEIDNSLKL